MQVQDAYVQHGSTHDIVSFMQQLGYRDFAAAGPEEAKIEQFKRALKLTRPTSNASKPPKEKVQHYHECIMCIADLHLVWLLSVWS